MHRPRPPRPHPCWRPRCRRPRRHPRTPRHPRLRPPAHPCPLSRRPLARACRPRPRSDPSGPVVRGVFFFSPTCPHCEEVIAEDLPDFFGQSGGEAKVSVDESLDPGEVAFYFMSNGRLQLLAVNVAIDGGARMFSEDSARLGLGSAGVPRIDIADAHFTGSVDIPERLPAIIEDGLAGAGYRLAPRAGPGRRPGRLPGGGRGTGWRADGRRCGGHAARADPVDVGACHPRPSGQRRRHRGAHRPAGEPGAACPS